MGNLNENYVMTTASGLSGFAILVSPNHLNQSTASVLQSQITALQGWNNASVNAARVTSWMDGLASGSALKGKYLMYEITGANRVAYWNAVLALKGNNTLVWVAYDENSMCMVRPNTQVTQGGIEKTIATIYIPSLETCLVAEETYAGTRVVSEVVLKDWEMNWSEVARRIIDLEERISALEG